MTIHWLVQSLNDHLDLAEGHAPPGLLNEMETHRLASFQIEKRRRDWLLGRWTAKQLLQAYLAEGGGQPPALERLVVENDADGAPYAMLEDDAGMKRLEISLSISHANGRGFCALHPEQIDDQIVHVGADIEFIEPRAQRFVEDYFTAEERECVRTAKPALHDTFVTAIWSAKESVLKAVRTGLRVDTQSVCVQLCLPAARPDDLTAAWIPLEIEIGPRLGRHVSGATRFTGWWRVLNNAQSTPEHVLTLAFRQDIE